MLVALATKKIIARYFILAIGKIKFLKKIFFFKKGVAKKIIYRIIESHGITISQIH